MEIPVQHFMLWIYISTENVRLQVRTAVEQDSLVSFQNNYAQYEYNVNRNTALHLHLSDVI
jgi:hypothetical protein